MSEQPAQDSISDPPERVSLAAKSWLRPDVISFRTIAALARPFFRSGRFVFAYRDVVEVELGDGKGPLNGARFNSLAPLFEMLVRPELAIGETFMNDEWRETHNDLAVTLGTLLKADKCLEQSRFGRILEKARIAIAASFRRNNAVRSRRNAAHHYDIGNDLYRSFLDEEMVYSCAFFSREAQSLEAAQRNKIETSLDRLDVRKGDELLDIGCGWGAMTRAAARRGARAVGVTLADRQLVLAEELVPPDLDGRLEYHLQDYRRHAELNPERYDRIVSIGMFEHVGPPQVGEFFDAVRRLLKPGGRALIHGIVKPLPSRTNAWIDKYIFPGGVIPRLDDIVDAAEAGGLTLPCAPFEHEGSNYANTLRHWRRRFNAAFPSLDTEKYDERFRRMWNFYLAGSEAAFEALRFGVAQVLLERPD